MWVPGFLCVTAASGRVSRQTGSATTARPPRDHRAPTARLQHESAARLISAKNLWILPKTIKESVDLPDFIKESVSQTQILCTF